MGGLSGQASLDRDGRFTRVDAGFADIMGAPEGLLVGRALEEAVQIVHVGVGQPPFGAPWDAEARPNAQRHRWIRLEATPLEGAGERVALAAVDITEQRRGDIFRAAAVKLAELIADGMRTDVEERLSAALHEVLPFDRYRLLRLEGSANQAVLVMSSRAVELGSIGFGPYGQPFPGAAQTHVDHPWGDTLVGRGSPSAIAIPVEDLEALEDPPAEARALLAEGFRSVVAVPLRIARRIAGALVLDRVHPGPFSDAELELLGDLAPLLSSALDRIRLERVAVDSASVYATVFETAGEGIILSDVETGRIAAVNSRYLELTGYGRKRLLDGMHIHDLDPTTARDPAERARAIREQNGPAMTHHVKRSGKRLPVEVTRRMFTWRGRATELTVVRDVRERLKAERQIRQLAAAVDAVSLGVLLTSGDGTVVFVNPALVEMIGASAEAIVGRRVQGLRTLPTDGDFEGEVTIEAPRGHFPAYVSRALFQSRAGSPAGAVEIWTDLTEQKERDQQLLQADKLAALGQTAASVAHEINNPLAFIIANLQTLIEYVGDIRTAFDVIKEAASSATSVEDLRGTIEETLADPRLAETLDDIGQLTQESLRGAERVRTIVADLRAYARRRDIMQPCELTGVLDNALTLVKNELRYRAEVVIEKPERLPRVIGSPGRLEQVLLNLLLNAVQSLAKEGTVQTPNRITIRLRAQDNLVCCEIQDTGSGIAPEVMPKIFNQFFTTKDVKRGTGLGLYICKKIIEDHGGRIEVDSRLGFGSTFRVYIPAEEEDEDDAGAGLRNGNGARRGRILIVDDEEMVLESLARVISPHHDVVTAQSGQVGLRRARTEPFDVILCDLAMPDLPGDEIYAELKRTKPDIGNRFVIISGGAVSPEAASVTEHDEVHRLVKPIPPERLLALLARLTAPR